MSTDLERELRELFREKAGEAPVAVPTPAAAPQEVLRRGRLHQVGTIAGTLAVVAAVVVGSVAGMNSLLRGGDTVGGGDYEVFQRNVTIEAFSLSSPSDWYLVNGWPLSMQLAARFGTDAVTCMDPDTGEVLPGTCVGAVGAFAPAEAPPYGLPMLQLSNVDLGLSWNVCRDGLPVDGVAMYIALSPATHASFLEPFPSAPMPGLPSPSPEGPCGPGSYSSFTVHGTPMFSWVGSGPAASEEDRATVQTTWEQMWAHDDWTPSQPEHDTPAYVLAGGTSGAGDPWRIELRPGEPTPVLSLEGRSGTSRLAGERVTVPAVPIDFCCAVTDGTDAATFLDATFGFITKDATGVELHVVEADEATGEVIEGTILPLPPSLDIIDADVFFISGTAGLSGSVVPVVPEGDPEPPTQVDEPRTSVVELSASFEGQVWTARFKGSFADGTACVFVTVDEPYEPFCAELPSTSIAGEWPFLKGTLTPNLFLLAGSIPPAVDEIRFVSDDLAIVPTQIRCATGPLGWTDPDRDVCAIALPSSGSGTLRYFDANGGVLFEEGVGWGSAQPEVTSEWAIAEGTICGERWTLTRVRSEQGFGLNLEGTGGHHLSEGMSVLGEEALPTHWVPIYGCPDPADTPSAPESIIYGLVSRQADAVWLVTGTGDVLEASLATESGDGPFVFWAILDGFHRGEIIAFDASCMEIARGSFDSGPASEEPSSSTIPPVECIP